MTSLNQPERAYQTAGEELGHRAGRVRCRRFIVATSVAKFPFRANGKAHGYGDPTGFAKVIAPNVQTVGHPPPRQVLDTPARPPEQRRRPRLSR